jgi:hypothetical protein
MGLQAPGEGQDALSALPLAALRRIFEYLRPRDLCLVERICTYRPQVIPNHRTTFIIPRSAFACDGDGGGL